MSIGSMPGLTIIDHYTPESEEDVNEAIDFVIEKLRSKIIKSEQGEAESTERALKRCRFAVTHEGEWKKSTKKKIETIRSLLNSQLRDEKLQRELSKNPCEKSVQNQLLALFTAGSGAKSEPCCELAANQELSAVRETSPPYCYFVKDEATGNCELKIVASGEELPHDLGPELRREILQRTEQIDIIEEFLSALYRDYYPILFLNCESFSDKEVEQERVAEFRKYLRPIIPKILFRTPKIVGKVEKALIVKAMNRLLQFFGAYNSVKSDSEEELLLKIRDKLMGQGYNSHIDSDLGEKNFNKLLKEIIQMFLLDFSKPAVGKRLGDSEKFLANSAATVAADICSQYLLSPYFFCLLFDHLFLEDIEPSSRYFSTPNFSSCDRSDEKFNEDVGKVGVELLCELLKFAEAPWLAMKGVSIINNKMAGALIQQGINVVLGTDTSLQPLQFLEKIFYRGGEPALREALKKRGKEEVVEYMRSIEERVKNRLMNLLVVNLSSILKRIPKLEETCKTLSSKLFNLTQSKRLLTLLLCYLLQGVRDSFASTNPYSEAPHEK